MASVDIIARLKLAGEEFNREFDSRMSRVEAQARTASARVNAAFSGLKSATSGLVAGIGAASVVGVAKQALDYASSLGEVSQQLGVTTKDLQVYRYAASQVGIEQDTMDKSLAKLTMTIGKAATGGEAQRRTFAALGIDVRDASGHIKTAGQVIPEIAAALQKVESPAQRAAVEVALFGKAGQKLDTLLAGGRAGIDELSASAERLGIVLSDEQIQKADETADKMAALKQVLEANIARAVTGNADAILTLVDALAKLPSAAGGAMQWYTAMQRRLELFNGTDKMRMGITPSIRREGQDQTVRVLRGMAREQAQRLLGFNPIGLEPAPMRDRLPAPISNDLSDFSGRESGGTKKEPSFGERLEQERRAALYSAANSYRGAGERNANLASLLREASINVDPKMVAWCAAFVNAVLATNGLPGTGSLSAKSFLGYGSATSDPERGDIVVSKRRGGGHVGFFEGFDANGNVRVLGGNTSDRVATQTVKKGDVLGFRRTPDAATAYTQQQAEDERRAEARREAEERVAEALGEQREELERQLRLGDMRARGLEDQAEIEEAIAQLRRQMLPLIEAEEKITGELAEDDRARLAVLEAMTIERVKQGHAAEKDRELQREREKAAAEAEQLVREELEKRDQLQREQIQDLADFYERAFRSGGKSILEDFEDQALSMIADIAAQWTLALLSGQKVGLPDILGQISGQGGASGGPLGSIMGVLTGGGGFGTPGFGGWGAAGQQAAALAGSYVYGGGAPGRATPAGGAAGAIGGAASALGQAVPYAAAAMAATSAISSILGIKNNAGGIFGVGGNLLINAISPARRGGASLSFSQYGELGVGDTFGNSKKRIGSATDAAGSLADMLSRIAAQLGGEVTGAPSLYIGMRGKDWRVNPTGRASTKTSKGAVDFGQDQAAAIRFALGDALKDGVIGAISDTQKRLIAAGGDLEKALDKALLVGEIPKRLKAMVDPLGAALDDFEKGWKRQLDALKEGGASAEEMADAHKLYKLELDEVKASTRGASSSLKDFLESIKFGSSSPYSLRDQQAAAEAALKPLLGKIDAEGRLSAADQQSYVAKSQALLDIERQLGGSTSAYFDKLDMIQAYANKAIGTIDAAAPVRTIADPFIEATAGHTQAIANISDQMNQRLANIEQLLGRLGGGGGDGGFVGSGRHFYKGTIAGGGGDYH
jgi:uncharacterized protein (TIGR02594 family)